MAGMLSANSGVRGQALAGMQRFSALDAQAKVEAEAMKKQEDANIQQKNMSYGGLGGMVIGTAIGGPIGGAIGGLIGTFGGSLF